MWNKLKGRLVRPNMVHNVATSMKAGGDPGIGLAMERYAITVLHNNCND